MKLREILFEGFTEGEILDLPAETIEGMIIVGEPIVFRVGSATILGSLKIHENTLVIELAHIDGGGEGVLLALGSLARRYVEMKKLLGIEWIVHAINCAKPNLKLRKMLERRGFVVEHVEGRGAAYHFIDKLPQ